MKSFPNFFTLLNHMFFGNLLGLEILLDNVWKLIIIPSAFALVAELADALG